MAELKTKMNDQSVEAFLNGIEQETRRQDSFAVLKLLQEVTQLEARMWGDSMIGFGSYHYKYESGHEGDSFLIGFSPRKQNLALYIMGGLDRFESLTSKLGKFKSAKSCLYVNKLADVDLDVLRELARQSFNYMKAQYPSG